MGRRLLGEHWRFYERHATAINEELLAMPAEVVRSQHLRAFVL